MSGTTLIFSQKIYEQYNYIETSISAIFKISEKWENFYKFPDIKIVEKLKDKKSIGIGQIKEAIKFLNEKPISLQKKVLILTNFQIVTTEAQNALLKTLEEPPSTALIYLLAESENGILPTIKSRCRLIKLKNADASALTPVTKVTANLGYAFATIIKAHQGELLDIAEELAKEEKEDIILVLKDWVKEGRANILKAHDSSSPHLISKVIAHIIEAVDDLEHTNVNTKLCIENLLLNFKE